MNIKINISTLDGDSYPLHIWDYYYSLKQYLSFPNNPTIDIQIEKIDNFERKGDITILHMRNHDDKSIALYVDKFDIIIIDNNMEPTSVSSQHIVDAMKLYPNVYFLCASFVSDDFPMSEKVITFSNDWVNTLDLFTNPMMPPKHAIKNAPNRKGISYVGGQLRSYRKYILDNLPSVGIKKIQNATTVVTTNDVYLDTDAQQFIDYCNELYNVCGDNVVDDIGNPFYKSVLHGIDGKRRSGNTLIGYYALEEYTTNNCIIYPETSFMNYEVLPTEKTFKCVACKTHWVMFAGAGSYAIMKEYGFDSILSLVPNGLDFDKIKNHQERIDAQMNAIEYLVNTPSIFDTDEAMCILENNYENYFMSNLAMVNMVDTMDNMMAKHV
jgi:hypothetical protein